jgi:hypothetical protein
MTTSKALVFRPSVAMRIGLCLVFVMAALMFLAGMKDLPPDGVKDWFRVAFTLVSLFGAVTYPLRAVIFENGTVRERNLGGWRTTRLPPRVRVERGLSIGSIYVIDAATNRVLVNLKREFGPLASREARVRAWLRAEGRL